MKQMWRISNDKAQTVAIFGCFNLSNQVVTGCRDFYWLLIAFSLFISSSDARCSVQRNWCQRRNMVILEYFLIQLVLWRFARNKRRCKIWEEEYSRQPNEIECWSCHCSFRLLNGNSGSVFCCCCQGCVLVILVMVGLKGEKDKDDTDDLCTWRGKSLLIWTEYVFNEIVDLFYIL